MPSIMYLMVRSAEGASRTTHGGDARSCFPVWRQFFHTLLRRDDKEYMLLGCARRVATVLLSGHAFGRAKKVALVDYQATIGRETNEAICIISALNV